MTKDGGATLWLHTGEAGGLEVSGLPTRRDVMVLAGALVLGGLVFAADAVTGFATALPVLYAGALAAVQAVPRPRLLVPAALAAAALTLGGLVAAPAAGLPDRLLALLVVAGAALLLEKRCADRAALDAAVVRADRLARAKVRFLSAASHDLRHPLQAGVLFHDLLSRRLRGTPHEELVIGVGRAFEMQRRMLDGLLELSRLDAGQIEVCPVRFSLRELMTRLAADYAPEAMQADLELAVVPSAAVVVSDPALLERILRSLLDNAVKYTPRGRVLLGCRHRGRMVSIQVWDTGIGIPADRLSEIFEEFQQLRVLAHDGGKGLGLGLAVAERLARAIGHPLGVKSEEGRGSVFEVVVPLAGG